VTATIRTSPPGLDPAPEWDSPTAQPLFLYVDDEVSLTQIFGQTRILTAQLLIFFFHRITPGLRPALLRSQSLEDSIGPLSPPIGKQRRVQALAAEKGAQATSRRSSSFSLHQDALFVFHGEGTPLGFYDNFGIRPRSQHRIGARFGCRSTALRLATLAFAPFRDSQTPRGKNTKRIPVHLFLFLPRPAH